MHKEKIAVIGAGLMGNGIAQVCAEKKFDVICIDSCLQAIEKAKQQIVANCDRKIAKSLLSNDDKISIIERINYSTSLSDLSNAHIIVEAIPENLTLKKEIFQQIERICLNDAILATNTSGLSISAIARGTKRPENVIGVHFFSPVPVMKLVEIIRGIVTSDETYNKMKQFVSALDKTSVDCQEYPGFIVNRLLVPMINEAAFLVMEGAKAKDIDIAMRLGANHPMGPLELCDVIGIDVVLAIMDGLYDGFKESKYRPCPLLVNMVNGGYLGKKTGQGFYQYP